MNFQKHFILTFSLNWIFIIFLSHTEVQIFLSVKPRLDVELPDYLFLVDLEGIELGILHLELR